MRRIILFAAAGIAAVTAFPGGTALADGASQPQPTSGEQASPNFGSMIMCTSPAQVSYPGAQNNCPGTATY